MKHFPPLLVAALAAAACAGPSAPVAHVAPAPAPLRYRSDTGHYRYESHSHVVQDAMGQVTTIDLATGALFTVSIADTAENLGVAITIDSLGVTSPAQAIAESDLAAARGATIRLVSSRQGEALSLTPPDSAGPVVEQLAQGLRQFLPQLPTGVPDSGATWTDSSATTVPSRGIALTVHTTREHRVVGWEDHGGTRALHLVTTSRYTLSGSGQTQGQELDLDGSGQRTADDFVSARGVYLGGTLTDSSLINANVVNAGIVVPVRSRTERTFTRLP